MRWALRSREFVCSTLFVIRWTLAAAKRYNPAMVYLRDIASRLDVSVSLVSKVLNDRLGTTAVSPAVIRSIRETAKEMGYRKNYSAAALREGRHHAIGIFLHRTGVTGSGLLEDLLDGALFEAHARHQKQLLNFFETADDFRQLREFAHRGMIGRADRRRHPPRGASRRPAADPPRGCARRDDAR